MKVVKVVKVVNVVELVTVLKVVIGSWFQSIKMSIVEKKNEARGCPFSY